MQPCQLEPKYLRMFCAQHCAELRRYNMPVNYHALALALHKEFRMEWATALETSRSFVDGWLQREDARTHRSQRAERIAA